MIVLDWNRLKLILGGVLSPTQVEGINALITELELYGVKDKNLISYLIATALLETKKKFQPQEEQGTEEYFEQMYGIEGPRSAIAVRLKNTKAGDGYTFRKRGIVGLLGRKAYEDMSLALSMDLVTNPDLVLDKNVAYKILVHGCMRGLFTGVSLSKYINDKKVDFINARRTVNGTDNAKRLALIAEQIVTVIKEV